MSDFKHGGVVSIIMKKHIKYEEIEEINKLEEEIICIKIKIKNTEVFIITYYNPPNKKNIDKKIFEFIEENYNNYIICGDFNAKHTDFGCKVNNKNGTILNDFINSSTAILLNKKDQHTFYRDKRNYKEILDIFKCSSNIYSLIEDCEVDYDSNLQSDHIPIKLILKDQSVIDSEEISQEKHLNYSKANWTIFRKKLDLIDISNILKSEESNEINNFLINSLVQAAENSIPYKTNNLECNTRLP